MMFSRDAPACNSMGRVWRILWMRRLVDKNILIDETLEDSERHEMACRLVDSSEALLVPRVVLPNTCGSCSKRWVPLLASWPRRSRNTT